MAATTTGTRSSNGATTNSKTAGLIIPRNSSEFHALVNQQRALHSGLHGDTADIAAFLRANLPAEIERRGGTRSGLLGLDARVMARRVAKPLQDAARLDEEIAKLWVVSWVRFQENVLNVKRNRGQAGGFNADA
jgi:hypothetical protein